MKWVVLFLKHSRLLEMGFTKATNGQSIPEYKCDGYLSLFEGAELYEISKEGSEILLAIYDNNLGQFIKINN